MNREPASILNLTDWRGRFVVLPAVNWQHIGENHQDLPTNLGGIDAVLDAIAHTVRAPELIRGEPGKPRKSCVYRQFVMADGRRRYFRVIIWYEDGEVGEIQTAHLMRKPDAREVTLWP